MKKKEMKEKVLKEVETLLKSYHINISKYEIRKISTIYTINDNEISVDISFKQKENKRKRIFTEIFFNLEKNTITNCEIELA